MQQPYRESAFAWPAPCSFAVLSASASWGDAAATHAPNAQRRSTSSLVILTTLTLSCALPMALAASLGWMGSSTTALPIASVLMVIALFAAVLTRDQGSSRTTLQARVREARVEITQWNSVLGAFPLLAQTIAVQRFASQGVAAMTLLAQSGERVVFWADCGDGNGLFDPSLPVHASEGRFHVALFDKHVELRGRSLAKLVAECVARQRAAIALEQPVRADVSPESAQDLPGETPAEQSPDADARKLQR